MFEGFWSTARRALYILLRCVLTVHYRKCLQHSHPKKSSVLFKVTVHFYYVPWRYNLKEREGERVRKGGAEHEGKVKPQERYLICERFCTSHFNSNGGCLTMKTRCYVFCFDWATASGRNVMLCWETMPLKKSWVNVVLLRFPQR